MKKNIIIIVFAVMGFISCDIPGPWEYDVTETSIYQGIYVSGHIIAGRDIADICFEKLNQLTEVSTSRYPFYKNAEVFVYAGADTAHLSAQPESPNCFASQPGFFIPQAGVDYYLRAEIEWDSMGTVVQTIMTSRAQVPSSFAIRDTARYEFPKLQPPPAAGDTLGMLKYIFTLDEDLRDSVLLSPFVKDTVLLGFPLDPAQFNQIGLYILTLYSIPSAGSGSEAPPVNLTVVTQQIVRYWNRIYALILYYQEKRPKAIYYTEGDTIQYLYGAQNLSSHYYPSLYSDDVGSILVSHEFTDSALFAETRFSNLLGLGIQPEDAYYSGTQRRLIVYNNTISEDGSLLFDNIPVINYWYVGGKNRIYVYAFERFYEDYVSTAVAYGDDSKVTAVNNIQGARGFFVGGIVDTFDFYVQINPLKQFFTREETFNGFCNKGIRWGKEYGGWSGSKDCREYLPDYCEKNKFTVDRCAELIIEKNMIEGNQDTSTLFIDSLWSAELDSIEAEIAGVDTTLQSYAPLLAERNLYTQKLSDSLFLQRNKNSGVERYCVHHNFPSSYCDSLKVAAHDLTKSSAIQEKLLTFCSDHEWDILNYAQCGPALVVSVEQFKKAGTFSKVLEAEAKKFCSENPLEKVCNK